MANIPIDLSEDTKVPITIDIEEGKRVSNPGKQALASVADLFTDLPGLAGLIGAGGQAGFNYLIDGSDKSFADQFKSAASSGIDADLLQLSDKGRTFTNEILGIQEPTSIEDIVARNTALFIPIPGIRLAKGASKAARAARFAMDVTLPTVKRGSKASMATRGVIQGGIGLGIDQGVKALADDPNHPLLFSDTALKGGIRLPVPKGAASNLPEHVPVPGEVTSPVSAQLIGSANAAPLVTIDLPVDPTPLTIDLPESTQDEFVQDQVDRDAKMVKAGHWEDVKTLAILAGALVGGAYLTKKFRNKRTLEAPVKPNPEFSSAKHAHETLMDKGKVSKHVFEEQGLDDITREAVDADAHTDVNGIARQAVIEGKYGQGFDNNKWTSHSANVLETDEAVLRQAGKGQTFDDAMKAQSELSVVKAGRDPSLWRKGTTDKQLETQAALGRADPEVRALMDKHAENYRADLEYEVHRGLTTREDAKELLGVFGDIKAGEVGTYMPFYGVNNDMLIQKLARKYLGINTSKGDELRTVAEFQARSGGNATELVSPGEAISRHRLHNTAYINEELYKSSILSRMARVHVTGADAGFTREAGARGRGTRLVGVGHDIKTDPNNIFMNIAKEDGLDLADQSINDLRNHFGKNLVTVQHRGKLYAYDVPNAGIRASLELSPRLGKVLEGMNHWKNVFTKFTTGNYSLFAPMSHAFSAQQVASTTAARSAKQFREEGKSFASLRGAGEGFKSLGRSLGGSKEIFLDQMAGDIADYLARSIATDKGLGAAINKLAPKAMARRQKVLHERISSSMLGRVRSETGRTATGIGTTFDSLEDMIAQHGQKFSNFYGAGEMGLLKKAWKAINNAANEGPAYGAMLKELDGVVDPSIGQLRKAVNKSKDLAGDMSRRGSSQFAKGVNASIPFSSPMIQSWNALGSAAKADWRGFSVGVGALIGAPTLMEMGMNAAISKAYPEGFPDRSGNGKMWTYDDYYWNGFTTQQRTDNAILFIPGQPPWEAIVLPISPEWGLFRSIVIEGADAMFNFSRTGAIGTADDGRDKVGRDHFIGALHRVLDLPLPPLGAAALSALGIDVRAGAYIGDNDNPEAPSPSFNLLESLPIGTGERITSRMGRSKDVNGSLDKSTAAWIKDIFGAGGTAYVAFHEAVNAGTTNVGGSLGQGISQGVESILDSARRQARYTQPLFGKVFKTSSNDEITATLHNKRQALLSLSNDAKTLMGSQGVIKVDGKDVIADTIVPTQDPIRQDLARDAMLVKNNVAMLDKTIATLRKEISAAALSTDFGSQRKRQDYVDGKNSEIQAYRAQQLGTIHTYEEEWSEMLTKKYGRDITVDLSGGIGKTIAARPNLSSASPIPRK